MAATVVVTASGGSFPGLAQALKGSGVEVRHHPLIGFAEPRNWEPVDQALLRLSSYAAVALTSPRAAAAVAGRLRRLDDKSATAARPPVWVSGAATARALGDVLGPILVPGQRKADDGAAATLALAMLAAKVAGRVLFLCGETHREELPDLLRGGGIEVDEVVCYRSVLATEAAAHAASTHGTLVIVGSPAVADLLARACPPHARPDLLAVGPTTATAARASGWPPVAVAVEPTAEAVAAAVRNVLATRPSHD
jgi:uroporphyrinogen-III synthase